MRYLPVPFTLLLMLVLFGTGTVMPSSDGGSRPQDSNLEISSQETLLRGHLKKGSRHKLILGEEDRDAYNSLVSHNAIVEEVDYGSFKMVIVDERPLGGRESMMALQVPARDEQDFIGMNGYLLDGADPEPALGSIPSDMRQTDMAEAIALGTQPRGGLYLVQFIGPIKDEWLAALRGAGASIITYIPSNSYVVRASRKAAQRLVDLQKQSPFVQFVGDYEPAFRLSARLQAARTQVGDELMDVTVQVIDGPGADRVIDGLKKIAVEFAGSDRSLNYHNLALKVKASQLTEIAHMDGVFAVEERVPPSRLDEVQGQIVAGNLSGGIPSGPGYLNWLASKGFTSSGFQGFCVNVVDDAYSLAGHPDIPGGRIAFQHNWNLQTGPQKGHGFLNAHIVAGFNNGFGPAVEDGSGYNYGLGIAPFARVGVTAIFGQGSFSSPDWEGFSYPYGARISNNSWGYEGVNYYSTMSQKYDKVVRDCQSGVSGSQQMIIVFAAGNEGSGSMTLRSPATAKNVMTVGASENVRPGIDGCGYGFSTSDNADDIAPFSSRGPVLSVTTGPVKPDIVAPGVHIQAGIPQSNYTGETVCDKYFPFGQTLYSWSTGTSHAAPAVAGAAALLYQDFLNKGRAAPSPAMAKAYLMNSATHMTGAGANDTLPSNSQGMGRLNLGRAFDGAPRYLLDQTTILGATGQTFDVGGTVADTSKPFRVTLAWSDAPGSVIGNHWVNNLDLEVTAGGVTYKGNVFFRDSSVSGGAADDRNNVESVFIPAGVSGNFTVRVRATNIAGDGVPNNVDTTDQDFALVIYNGDAAPQIAVSPSSLFFSSVEGLPNQTGELGLSITNSGAGTLNWSAVSNSDWLFVNPASGTAPSTALVHVESEGLPAGTYRGAIIITGNGSNSPTSVSVTLSVRPGFGFR